MVKVDVDTSYNLIKSLLVETPCIFSPWLSKLTNAKVYLKLENFNKTGSFKDRGVASFLLSHNNENIKHVTAASAGNHAQAVAFYAQKMGIKASIFMPRMTPNNKVFQTKRFNAEVILNGDNYDESFIAAKEFACVNKAHYIHAYNDLDIIAGQGSVALEIIKQGISPDIVFVPVGGGGLISGMASYFAQKNLKIKTIGVEAKNFESMAAALKKGFPYMLNAKNSIAEGIAVRMVGEFTYDICASLSLEMIHVSDEQIQSAIMFLLEKQKIITEGAGAAGVAGLLSLSEQENIVNKTVVVVISGGNIDLSLLARLSNQELIRTSRLYKFSLTISDTPGSLSNLLILVSMGRANIIDIQHERFFAKLYWNEVLVNLTVEIRDEEHLKTLLDMLNKEGYKVSSHSLGNFSCL